LLWGFGDAKTKPRIHKAVRAGEWDVLLSVYNDFIFQPEDLASVATPLRINLHPAIPIAGVGYDTWPLILGHTVHGTTAHFLTPEIDSGRIINVMDRPLSADATYADLRIANQELQLEQLFWLCQLLTECDDTDVAMSRLEAEAEECGREWSPKTYVSVSSRQSQLEGLRRSDPGHRVFMGLSNKPNLTVLPDSMILPSGTTL
jgi:methionyl-tRNA formyltransferase